MNGRWSEATGGVWAGKLGGLASGPREGDGRCHCSVCSRPTTMTGTKLCDRCWERRRHAPEADEALAALEVLLADVRGSEVIGWISIVWTPGEPGSGKQEAGSFIAAEQARAVLRRSGRRP